MHRVEKHIPRSVLLKINSYLIAVANNIVEFLKLCHTYLNRRIFMRLFKSRKDDVYIVTYMKSGTTLMQMILYQLLTDGNMNFQHIYNVSPWIDKMAEDAENVYIVNDLKSPRIFKSHALYGQFPKDFSEKIIYVIRDGMDVANSSYHHFKNYIDSNLQWDDYIENHFLYDNRFSWFSHVKQWKENKNNFDILFVSYEDLTKNMRGAVEKISHFLGLSPGEDVLDRLLERCSFAYMKEHQDKFGEQPKEQHKVYDQFIRKGESSVGKRLFSEFQRKKYQKMYNKYIGSYIDQ